MGILVRRLQKSDLEEVCDMQYALDMMFEPERNHQRITPRQLYLRARSLNPNSPLEILVAEMGERVVGYLEFVTPPTSRIPFKDAIYVGGLYVKPEYRRQGAGTALIETIKKLAQDNRDTWRARRIIANAGSREFYENIGFVPMKYPQRETIPMWSHEYTPQVR